MVVLVPAENLNPEEEYYYESNLPVNKLGDDPLKERCPVKGKDKIEEILTKFEPRCDKSKEMTSMVREKMGINLIASVEVDHCPQSYSCLIVTKDNFTCGSNRIIYSGDTRPC